MWLHCAPAEAMIVVSEIGEQWSPHTAPAMQAETAMIVIELPGRRLPGRLQGDGGVLTLEESAGLESFVRRIVKGGN